MKKGKSTDGLMRHIRNKHKIDIEGSREKRELLTMGYYHGYKRYRYIKNSNNIQNFTCFSEIEAIYEFDIGLKNLIYPMITKIETTFKNITIDCLVYNSNPDIEYIYKEKLIGYLDYNKVTENKKYSQRLKERLDLRSKIDETIAYNYGKNDALSHFVHNSRPIPLWVYFELITFGEFGYFFNALSKYYRLEISRRLGIDDSSKNQNGRLLADIVFTLTDLRNATMHNAAVFDANFNKSGISRKVKEYFQQETGLKDLNLEKIMDYIFIMIVLLKKQKCTKIELKSYIRRFNNLKENLYNSIPMEHYWI